jgi:hypothetical protein
MNRETLKPYIGSMQQLAGIRTSVLDDGKGRGLRVADVDNGSGLTFTALLDRGMDIGKASFKGVPLAYMSPVGYSHPAHFEGDDLRWLRNFTAGLMTGCGLTNVGLPDDGIEDDVDGPMGLHGRLSNTPAENVAVSERWKNDQYQMSISGIVREACFGRENLELKRTISTAMGDNSITFTDRVTNLDVKPSPLMLLYHINIGYPLLSENATLRANVAGTTPRNEDAAKEINEWMKCHAPVAGIDERCFFHNIGTDSDGMARMTIQNPDIGLALEIAYRKKELPYFTQWKMLGEQQYVMGLEPANCHPDGQTQERENGTLRIIEPDETIEHKVTIAVREL